MTSANLTKNRLTNRDFERAIRTMRRILPKLAFSLLILTYLISAVTMGIFHAQHAQGALMTIAAFAVPLAIQAGRGTIVFFFQLNPARVQSRFSIGIISATVLLILSLVEAYLSTSTSGIAWAVSVGTLMLIGYLIEVLIMRETQFATKFELYQNRDQWDDLKKFYLAKEDFENFMDDLQDGNVPDERPDPDEFLKLKNDYTALQEQVKHLKDLNEKKQLPEEQLDLKILENQS